MSRLIGDHSGTTGTEITTEINIDDHQSRTFLKRKAKTVETKNHHGVGQAAGEDNWPIGEPRKPQLTSLFCHHFLIENHVRVVPPES